MNRISMLTLACGLMIAAPAFAQFTTSPGTLNFGNVELSDDFETRVVSLLNAGPSPVEVNAFIGFGGAFADFSLLDPLPLTVAAESFASLSVKFDPTALGLRTATLTVVWAEGSDDISLIGSGIANVIPEPQTYALLLAGLGLLAFTARARRRALG